jgi:hypothetical protein
MSCLTEQAWPDKHACAQELPSVRRHPHLGERCPVKQPKLDRLTFEALIASIRDCGHGLQSSVAGLQ